MLNAMLRALLPVLLCAAVLTGCSSAPSDRLAGTPSHREMSVGRKYFHDGHLAQARTSFQQAIALAERVDDRQAITDAWLSKGSSELLLGDMNEARLSYERAGRSARFAVLPERIVLSDLALAEWLRRSGDTRAALRGFSALRQRVGAESTWLAQIEQGLLLCQIQLGELPAADALLGPWLGRLPALPIETRAAFHAAAARLRLAQGRLDEALLQADAALQLDREIQHPPAIADDHVLLAQLYRRAGQTERAQQHLDIGQRIYQMTGQIPAPTAPAGP